ncbi:IS110 family transposase [Aeromicrobium sp. YIM 150415]|uniref:IS110 family transposase n=1 Tax=Aeromicrobium sp. YIM 150415 TaxID=2803912 RepID=UPI0019628431|nr:IS110 family transposase [Aeromicrobium sp. YIM 150415]MBM9464926.1 IS110 family transposase [Aeromicrobium sp. YIM 150415]
MSIVAETYRFVVGVDTHAAHHSYAIIAAPTGAAIDQARFPVTPAGLDRAVSWVARRTGGERDEVLIAAEGTGSYGATMTEKFTHAGYRVTEAPTPSTARLRGTGKTDELDALTAARSSLAMATSQLRDARAHGTRAALQTLTSLRDLLNDQRLALINALTALVRGHSLGIDARRALTRTHIRQIASWRTRDEAPHLALIRATATRHAQAILDLETELTHNRTQISQIVTRQAPELLHLHGVGPITAAVVLTVWSHPGRIRSEAAMAAIAGTSPIPASSGNTSRHRLNRGGDRKLNRAINTIVLTRWRSYPETQAYIKRRRQDGKPDRDIRRCLRRYTTRQLWRTLNTHT